MRTDYLQLNSDPRSIQRSLFEIDRAMGYIGLSAEQANVIRLLAEESIAMTADVLNTLSGKMWFENDGKACEIHLSARAPIGIAEKEAFIAVSSEKKNTIPKGLRGKISALFESMLIVDSNAVIFSEMNCGMMPASITANDSYVWSLRSYEANAPKEEKDKLLEGIEKSIIENYADDVTVTVRSSGVELVIKKAFA